MLLFQYLSTQVSPIKWWMALSYLNVSLNPDSIMLKQHKSSSKNSKAQKCKKKSTCATVHLAFSSSRWFFHLTETLDEPSRRCWCTRRPLGAAPWWQQTWTESPPRCLSHTGKEPEPHCGLQPATQPPASETKKEKGVRLSTLEYTFFSSANSVFRSGWREVLLVAYY